MTLDDFIQKYEGQTKGYPTDTSYGGECLSLVKLYIKECFGINPPPSGTNSAYGYWSNFPSPLNTVFKKVVRTDTNVPKRGDIPIWKPTASNQYGHIDIFLEGTSSNFVGFDQNFYGRQAHKQKHDYNNVVGWLTPLNDIIEDVTMEWLHTMFLELGIDLNQPESAIRSRVQEILDGYKKYGELEKRLQKAERDLAFNIGEAAKYEAELQKASESRTRLEKEVAELTHKVGDRDLQLSTLQKDIDSLKEQIDPEKAVIITKEEYERLLERKSLDRHTTWELFTEWVSRLTKSILRRGR